MPLTITRPQGINVITTQGEDISFSEVMRDKVKGPTASRHSGSTGRIVLGCNKYMYLYHDLPHGSCPTKIAPKTLISCLRTHFCPVPQILDGTKSNRHCCNDKWTYRPQHYLVNQI
jgi:hypothetical protein